MKALMILIISVIPFSLQFQNSPATKPIVFKEQNYVPYFLEAERAIKLNKHKKHEKSYSVLDSLFNIYSPKNTLLLNECTLFIDLSEKLGKTHNLEKVVTYQMLHDGWVLSDYNKNVEEYILDNTSLDSLTVMKYNTKYRNGLNYALQDTLKAMFDRDQKVRFIYKDPNHEEIYKVSKLNNRQIIDIIKTHCYPGLDKVPDALYLGKLSVMLKHLSTKEKLEVQPYLYEELKKGNVAPWIYGSMLDKETAINKVDIGFPYYGTISNIKPSDTTECNNARESIGLPRIKF